MPEEFDKTGNDIPAGDDLLIRVDDSARGDSARNVPYPRLELIAGPQEGMAIPIPQGEQIIGRTKGQAHIRLDDTSVSRVHGRILAEKEFLAIEDLGSRNGISVNGKKIALDEKRALSHGDQIRIGVYLFRLALRPIREGEFVKKGAEKEKEIPQKEIPQEVKPEKGAFISPPVDEKPAPEKREAPAAPGSSERHPEPIEGKEELLRTVPPPISFLQEGPLGFKIKVVFVTLCVLSAIVGVGYFLLKRQGERIFSLEFPAPVEEEVAGEPEPAPEPTPAPAPTPAPEPAPAPAPPPPVKTDEKALRGVRTFLDIESKPTSARIFFQDRNLGMTPLKVPVDAEPGKEYTVRAEFNLEDIRDKYQQKLSFRADVRKEVVPLVFDAEIGTVKIMRLPRDVEILLEGFYAYDKNKSYPVRITNIIYGKPVYLPFGNYTIELRERVRVGDSQTFVPEIRYKRGFTINRERRVVELSLVDRDLQFFPARISSDPNGAEVFLDGEKVGVTPFSGELPLGRHELKLLKEGYFESITPLEMKTNTPFETRIPLKTSKVGELVNKGREFRRAGLYEQTVNELVEALKLEATDREKAEVYFLLGDSYFMMGNLQNAATYFSQAKSHEEFYDRALLGLARTQHAAGAANEALLLIVEIFLNTPESDPVHREGKAIFKQISPFKSVFYVASEPVGATVLLNGREVAQRTPVIIPEQSLGNYRIEIQKPGYQIYQVKRNLKLGEFIPIIATLKPEEL